MVWRTPAGHVRRSGSRFGEGTASGSERAEGLRPLNLPRAVTVRTDAEGDPVAVRGRRDFRRVEGIRECWRIDDEWWRRPISRLYYALVLEGGRSITLYRDLETKRWYLQ